MMARALLILAALGFAAAAVPGDLITSLPGFAGPFPSDQYSGLFLIAALASLSHQLWTSRLRVGFLEVGPGRFLHCTSSSSLCCFAGSQAKSVCAWLRAASDWLVLSENNPATDPVVLWMNGTLTSIHLHRLHNHLTCFVTLVCRRSRLQLAGRLLL